MVVDCGSARDRLGQTLGGTYVLRSVLGAGGTAVVYRASSTTSDAPSFAVKVLHDHLSRSEEVCRRFVREGQLGNVLDHPGTVRVLDHGSTPDGSPYLVLELLEGESLEERRVRLGGRLPLGETLALCDELLGVLETAHAKHVVHRDIKPSNLFLTSAGRLKVLDFGIARLVDESSATATKTGQMVGTPAFMPPEQALSRPRDVDARTDLWSVGATLFTLLSGEHVHIAETSSEHLVKAATLHARSLARALPGIPSNVESFVARCLSFDKSERWSSAAEMRAALAAVRADPGRAVGTSTFPPPERVPSSTNMPTVMTGSRVRPSSNQEERSGDLDANMSLTSSPDFSELVRPRRRWLLPFAVASSALFVLMSIVVLVLVMRTPPAASTASSARTFDGTKSVPEGASVGAPSGPPPSVAAIAPPGPLPPPPSASASSSHRLPAGAAATARPPAPTRKPPPSQGSRKDVYRPF